MKFTAQETSLPGVLLITHDFARDERGFFAETFREAGRIAQDHGEFLAAEGLRLRLTASVGVATLPDAAASAEELLRAADGAMYVVKNRGKNGIHVAERESRSVS